MKPFDDYPGEGRIQFGPLKGANARHEYGLHLQRVANQRACAYCGLNFTEDYRHWLTLQVDHVVPVSVAKTLGTPAALYLDGLNCVLACSTCNGFDNRFNHEHKPIEDWTVEAFVALRDVVFSIRRERITKLHVIERAFYESSPWASERDSRPNTTVKSQMSR